MDVRAGHGFQTPMRVRTLDADEVKSRGVVYEVVA